MNVGERIRARRKQLKLSVDALAEKLGKNRATIYRYESSEIENMPLEVLEPLAKALNVSPAYLMGWEEQSKQIIQSEYTYIPVSISAGLPLNVEAVTNDTTEKIEIPDTLMGKWAGHQDVYVMKINGESMNKTIPHESLIAVKKTEIGNLKDGDIVLYSHDNEYSVKRFYRTNGHVIFRPDSHDPSFTDYVVPADSSDLIIHGKVVVYVVELS